MKLFSSGVNIANKRPAGYIASMSVTVEQLTHKIVAFRDARDWKQFHNPKDLSISLVLEATEVLEHFQWKSLDEMGKYVETHQAAISEELADALYCILLLSHDLGIDVLQSLAEKLKKNEAKYPVEKARGRNVKYDQL